MMNIKIAGAVTAGALLLAGCATGSHVDQLRDTQGMGSPFTNALTNEYRELAVFEADEMFDFDSADYFARKGLAAAEGEVVLPEQPSDWDVDESDMGDLNGGRAELLSLLDANARTSEPTLAARAQGRYDCWVEQSEEGHQFDHIAACRDTFQAALAELEAAMAPEPAPPAASPEPAIEPESFTVYFGFDRAEVTQEAMRTLDQALSAAREMGNDIEFSVTGHADRAGPPEYNQRLSIRRAEAVSEVLQQRGVSSDRISVAGRGESEPAVETPDGVPEQRNRRVEIIIQ